MRVKKVEYVDGYRLKLQFSDKKVKIIDFADKLQNTKGIFKELKDFEFFKQVSLDDCLLSICWPNGADICPDVLYSMGEDVKEVKKFISKQKMVEHNRRRIKKGLL
ncbi:MAG: DUF2442 domain-containing protein [Chlamydiales bacterium]|nr:DUF2442 domain-containing protein [Chlamydiales bacterium]